MLTRPSCPLFSNSPCGNEGGINSREIIFSPNDGNKADVLFDAQLGVDDTQTAFIFCDNEHLGIAADLSNRIVTNYG